MEEQVIDLDFEDQYISVLLEFYANKSEAPGPSPMDQQTVDYWKKVVSRFERDKPDQVRSRIRYRASRAEKMRMNPVQVALVRYAWAAYLDGGEDAFQVLERWRNYLLDDRSVLQEATVEYDIFRRRREFRAIVDSVREAGLWPWDDSSPPPANKLEMDPC